MAEDKQLLMQLLNMFAGQMQGIGTRRQQGSQFRAGMEMDRAQMAQREAASARSHEVAMGQLEATVNRDKWLNKWTEEQIKTEKLNKELAELTAGEVVEHRIKTAPHEETPGELTERGVGEWRGEMTDNVGVLSQLTGLLKGAGKALDVAARGPQQVPGMTTEEWLAGEEREGVDPRALAGIATGLPKEPNYVQMKAAFEMSIVYGVDLPDEFKSKPGVIEAIDKGKTAYAKARTDADRIAAINIATAEANLKVAEWDAEHPGGRAPAGQPQGLVQNRAMANLESIVVNGGKPTDEQFMAAFGYLPDAKGKKAIAARILDNYEATQGGLIIPGGD